MREVPGAQGALARVDKGVGLRCVVYAVEREGGGRVEELGRTEVDQKVKVLKLPLHFGDYLVSNNSKLGYTLLIGSSGI